MRIFVDLDGVLVNFHQEAAKAFSGVKYPEKGVLDFEWLYNQANLPVGDFLDKIESKPGFWENLPPMAWSSEILSLLEIHHFGKWDILTGATRNPVSWSGKAEWVRRNMGVLHLHKLIIVHGDKSKLATPDSILIDDRLKNCKDWEANGGLGAFHWIEYTPDHVDMWKDQLKRLEDYLAKFSVAK